MCVLAINITIYFILFYFTSERVHLSRNYSPPGLSGFNFQLNCQRSASTRMDSEKPVFAIFMQTPHSEVEAEGSYFDEQETKTITKFRFVGMKWSKFTNRHVVQIFVYRTLTLHSADENFFFRAHRRGKIKFYRILVFKLFFLIIFFFYNRQ